MCKNNLKVWITWGERGIEDISGIPGENNTNGESYKLLW